MSIVSPNCRRSFVIVGTRASMEWCDSGEPVITLRRGAPADEPATIEQIQIARDMPLLLELRAFLAHLDGGPPPMTSACEGQLIVERTAEIEAAALAAVI
jgi:predicted dehydrogenase